MTRPSTLLLASALLAALSLAHAEPPATKEHNFEAVGAKAQIPEDWHIQEDSEEGVTVYQITREKLNPAAPEYKVGLTLTVTPDVPSRAEVSPSAYASDLLSFAVEDGGTVTTSENPPYKIYRAEYSIDGDAGAIHIVDVATANDATGTLYFVAWQCPEAEAETLAALREKILSSFEFDTAR